MQVEIEIADRTFVARPDSYLFAAIAFEGDFIELEFLKLVLRVAEVGYFSVFHCCWCLLFYFSLCMMISLANDSIKHTFI